MQLSTAEIVPSFLPHWLVSDQNKLILVIDEKGYPVFLNETIKSIASDKVIIGSDTIIHLLRYPEATGNEFVKLLQSSDFDRKLTIALLDYRQSKDQIIWTDWDFYPVIEHGKKFFVGLGVKSREWDMVSEKALHQSISKAISDGAMLSVTDRSGRILMVNNNFADFTGFSKAELIGKRHKQVLSDFHSKEFWKEMLITIKEGRVWKDDIQIKSKKGAIKWVSTIISPVVGNNGEVYRCIHIQFDITEHKKLLDHKKRISEIAFIQSHEFRRPIANMLGIIDLLNTEPHVKELPENILQWLDLLDESVKQADEIIAKIVQKTVSNGELEEL